MTKSCEFESEVLPLLEVAQPDWIDRARETAHKLIRTREYVTIDDVRDLCPPPLGVDPRVMGAVFKTKEWECIGYEKSKRKRCHNRPIGQFQLRAE